MNPRQWYESQFFLEGLSRGDGRVGSGIVGVGIGILINHFFMGGQPLIKVSKIFEGILLVIVGVFLIISAHRGIKKSKQARAEERNGWKTASHSQKINFLMNIFEDDLASDTDDDFNEEVRETIYNLRQKYTRRGLTG